MLASWPVRAAGDRIGPSLEAPAAEPPAPGGKTGPLSAGPAVAALVVCVCALFFGNGLSDAPLVWIGGIALVAAAAFLVRAPALGRAGLAYLGCLAGLALWCGVSVLWSASPDSTWTTTNRTLVYLGFAVLGVLVGPALDRVAAGATAVAAAVCGWALLAKCVPAIYSDYGRFARLRAPLDDANMLALVAVAGVALALWAGSAGGRAADARPDDRVAQGGPGGLAARSRVGAAVLLYLFVLTLLLTYSRFGVALACVVAAAYVLREPRRLESIATLVLGSVAGGAVFVLALALNGITSDGQSRSVRAHDGWVFALAVVGVAVVVALAARVPLPRAHERTIERAAAVVALAGVVAVVVLSVVKAGTIWHEFTNPVSAQTTSSTKHLTELGSGNRWTWWTEAWRGFTSHPLGGTGAGTFQLTDLRYRRSTDITALEPHNVPLQFLSETGIVGFLLWVGLAAAALTSIRRRGPLPLLVAAFFVHSVGNYDWNFVAVCGPFLFLAGVLVTGERERARRPVPAVAFAVVFALGCVYSLAAPWLAQRAEATATTLSQLKRAHSYDPLNTQIITEQAVFFEATAPRTAERYYRDAIALEPTNAEIWLELATFYAENGAWEDAYKALSKAYAYDPAGPAGQCGLARQIRRKVGIRTTCRGAGLPPIP